MCTRGYNILYIARLLCFWEERGLREPMYPFALIFQTLCNSSVAQCGRRSFRIPEQLGVCGERRAAKIPPPHHTMGRNSSLRYESSHLCRLTTLPVFHLKEEDGLFGPSGKLRLPWCLLFSSERLRWAGWSQSRCPFIHTAEQPGNRLFSWRGGKWWRPLVGRSYRCPIANTQLGRDGHQE